MDFSIRILKLKVYDYIVRARIYAVFYPEKCKFIRQSSKCSFDLRDSLVVALASKEIVEFYFYLAHVLINDPIKEFVNWSPVPVVKISVDMS